MIEVGAKEVIMGQYLHWQQIKERFPNEWVAIDHVREKSKTPYGDIVGEVVAHDKDETQFTQQLKKSTSKTSVVDIRYTGDILPDNPVGPLLWRISNTLS